MLVKKFKSPKEAEESFSNAQSQREIQGIHEGTCPPSVGDVPLQPPRVTIAHTSLPEVVQHCQQIMTALNSTQGVQALSELFSQYMANHFQIRSVPSDFLELTVNGIKHLRECRRTNVIYALSKAIGSMRADETDSLLPVRRMPFGLLECAVNFYTASSIQKVNCCVYKYVVTCKMLYYLFCIGKLSR